MSDSPSSLTSSTLRDVAKRHGFSLSTLYAWMAVGKGPRTYKAGKCRRVTDQAEREWIASLEAEEAASREGH